MSRSVDPGDRHVLQHREAAVLTLTLNRPERLNAVSESMYRLLIEFVSEPAESDRVIVLRGAGRAFCVGADLKDHREGRSKEDQATYVRLAHDACRAIQDCPIPVVAMVQGYALGAGAELALSCDFVVMSNEAEMGFPELSIGTYVGGGVTYLLPALVGLGRARELLFLGERFTGLDAADWGLVYRAVPLSELDDAISELTDRLSELAPLPTRFAKRAFHETTTADRAAAMQQEVEDLLASMETEDWKEGLRAFAEKRQPRFKGK